MSTTSNSVPAEKENSILTVLSVSEVFAKENFDEYQQDIKERSEFFKLERRMQEINDIID